MKKFIIFLLIIIIGIGVFLGIKSFIGKKEPTVTVDKPKEIVYKLVSIERLNKLPGDIIAKNQTEWLVLKVFGQNFDLEKRLYNMYYFTFEDDAGNVIENSPNSLTDAISFGELEPNATLSGTIVFKVPSDIKGKLIITDEKFKMIQELIIT